MKRISLAFLLIGMTILHFQNPGWSAVKGELKVASGLAPQPIYWYERDVVKKAWMATDEAAIFLQKGAGGRANAELLAHQFHPQAVITRENNFVIFFQTPAPLARETILSRLAALRRSTLVRQVSPVFYPSTAKHPDTRMVLTGEIIVQFPSKYTENRINSIEKRYGLQRLRSFDFSPNTFLYEAGDPLTSLQVANRMAESEEVNYAYPNWLRTMVKDATPNDTYFPNQWHLKNTGQGGGTPGVDVNITTVWDTYLGSPNEVICLVDDGLEIAHEDLAPNVLAGLCWDYVGGDADPTAGEHGTSCAGVAAGRGFNTLGITGAAPYARLVGYRLIGATTGANIADAETRNNQTIDIYSNSWGPSPLTLQASPPLVESALESGVTSGRGGLGSIYLRSGGNGKVEGDNSNYSCWTTSRTAITVAASTNYGVQSSYSEPGANLLVNSPSNGGSLGITTVDRTGNLGYNPPTDPGYVDYSNLNYTNSFGGTSSATPLVAGVVGLMLQANPNLNWRDVQDILAKTAVKNDPTDADWQTNSGGYLINHKYGFGRVDAQAAVTAAKSWTSLGPERSTQGTSNPNLPIPDNNPTGVENTIAISQDIGVRFVEIYFTAADHTFWGDLEITLVSPSGTVSVLAEQHDVIASAADRYDNWRFGSRRHLGESSKGTWKLRVKDLAAVDTGHFQSWTLKIYGYDKSKALPWLPLLLLD